MALTDETQMLISFYLLASLATLYFVVLAMSHLPRLNKNHDTPEHTGRLVSGFVETTATFLDAALIFSVSMLAAGVSRYASYIRHPEDHQSV